MDLQLLRSVVSGSSLTVSSSPHASEGQRGGGSSIEEWGQDAVDPCPDLDDNWDPIAPDRFGSP